MNSSVSDTRAALSFNDRAAHGSARAYKNVEEAERKLKGFVYDVNHIATYAPYCDSIVLDSVMSHSPE